MIADVTDSLLGFYIDQLDFGVKMPVEYLIQLRREQQAKGAICIRMNLFEFQFH
jgi:hypothetical protein